MGMEDVGLKQVVVVVVVRFVCVPMRAGYKATWKRGEFEGKPALIDQPLFIVGLDARNVGSEAYYDLISKLGIA